jgi:hypothetical protein
MPPPLRMTSSSWAVSAGWWVKHQAMQLVIYRTQACPLSVAPYGGIIVWNA